MKRIILVLITMAMIFMMFGCKKEEEEVIDGGYKIKHPETSPLVNETGNLVEFEVIVMGDNYESFRFEKDDKTKTYKLSHQYDNEYEEKLLNQDEVNDINGLIKTGGLLDLNGYEVWVNGIAPEAGYVQCGGRFDSGNSFYFEGNGGHIPDGFEANYRPLKKLLSGFFKKTDEIEYHPTLDVFKQQILDSGYIVGCGLLTVVDGPFGDGLSSLIGSSDFADLEFLYDINYEHYIEVDGQELYCVVPFNMDAAVAVSDMNGKILYSSAKGDPIFIMCNGNNVCVSVVDGNQTVTFTPHLLDGDKVHHCFK